MATIRARIELGELRKAIAGMEPRKLSKTVKVAVESGMEAMVRDVVLNKMSGQYLGIVTSTARKSMRQRTTGNVRRVAGEFGSPLKYVRAHEVGFRGNVSVPTHNISAHRVRAHSRKGHTIRAHTRQAHSRQAHSRFVKIRARHFMRDTLRENIGDVKANVQRALYHLARTGTVPTSGQVGA